MATSRLPRPGMKPNPPAFLSLDIPDLVKSTAGEQLGANSASQTCPLIENRPKTGAELSKGIFTR